jgi:general secretion pathway protein H
MAVTAAKKPMPISATGARTNLYSIMHSQRGFTLLEIMIVVIIIGIVTASVVTLAFHDNKRELMQQEADRLKAVIRLAQEEAVLESRIYALGIWRDGYAFYVPATDGWVPLKTAEDKRLGAHLLDEKNNALEFDLILDGIGVVLESDAPEKPQIYILSSGEMTAFAVDIKLGDDSREPLPLAWDPLGRLIEETRG